MSYEKYKIAIQYDGGHHATPTQRRSDIFRDENARARLAGGGPNSVGSGPFAPGMEPNAVTRVREALIRRGWKPGH